MEAPHVVEAHVRLSSTPTFARWFPPAAVEPMPIRPRRSHGVAAVAQWRWPVSAPSKSQRTVYVSLGDCITEMTVTQWKALKTSLDLCSTREEQIDTVEQWRESGFDKVSR